LERRTCNAAEANPALTLVILLAAFLQGLQYLTSVLFDRISALQDTQLNFFTFFGV
jgi:hypothetical protein